MLIKPKSWERHGLKPWIEAARKRLHNVLAIALAKQAMDRTRRSIFGHGDLDPYSLAEIVGLKIHAGLECRKCRKFSAIDVDELSFRNGCQFTLGEIRRLAVCRRCGSRLPQILVRSEVMRGDRAWFPRPPGATR